MNNRSRFIVSAWLFSLCLSTVPALASTVVVGACMTNKVSFGSISDAVQAVPTGSTIQICPGAYAEQVTISKSVTLKGIAAGNGGYAAIVPPAGGLVNNAYAMAGSVFWNAGTPFAAQILIQGGADVTLTNLAVDATGSGIAACSPVVAGVVVQDSSATLNQVTVKNQLVPCATSGVGVGVLAQNDSASPTAITVKNSTFVNAGQTFEADGASTTSTLTNNSMLGNSGSNLNAISILEGNSTIRGNSISNFSYPFAGTDFNSASFGIYLHCVPGSTTAGNVIANTQVGVYALNGCTTTNVSITGNTISNAQFIGIDAGGSNGLIQGNDIRSSLTAIRLPAGAAGNTIQNNTVNDVCAAFGSNPAAGVNNIVSNTVANAINLSIVNSTALCP